MRSVSINYSHFLSENIFVSYINSIFQPNVNHFNNMDYKAILLLVTLLIGATLATSTVALPRGNGQYRYQTPKQNVPYLKTNSWHLVSTKATTKKLRFYWWMSKCKKIYCFSKFVHFHLNLWRTFRFCLNKIKFKLQDWLFMHPKKKLLIIYNWKKTCYLLSVISTTKSKIDRF